MIRLNENFLKLQSSYLFSEIAKKVSAFTQANPDKAVIKMGIGDVTMPLTKECVQAFREGVEELGRQSTFKGYGPEQGHLFLRELVAEHDFKSRGAQIEADEIFISDGAKCDTANFQELFAGDIAVGVPDPVYPVYVDTNVMAGRAGSWKDGRYDNLFYFEGKENNNFVPSPPDQKIDLVYLCYPNNPTGATATKEQLSAWVAYAQKNQSLILFDAAYEAFIRSDDIPHSIFEIPGAKEVAVEFRSFSKSAGFTGVRCAFTVIPKECRVFAANGDSHSLRDLWSRRHSTKFNGASYPVQKAAAAIYTESGKDAAKKIIDYYLVNAGLIKKALTDSGFSCYGGDHSPYVWANLKRDSWETFDFLLNEAGVVTTPGSGFGGCGQGFVRFSAFNDRENVNRAMEMVKKALK